MLRKTHGEEKTRGEKKIRFHEVGGCWPSTGVEENYFTSSDPHHDISKHWHTQLKWNIPSEKETAKDAHIKGRNVTPWHCKTPGMVKILRHTFYFLHCFRLPSAWQTYLHLLDMSLTFFLTSVWLIVWLTFFLTFCLIDILSDRSSDILSDIFFDRSSDILSDRVSDILSDRSFAILSDIFSNRSSGILSDIMRAKKKGEENKQIFWHCVWHSFCRIFWHPVWHSLWQMY